MGPSRAQVGAPIAVVLALSAGGCALIAGLGDSFSTATDAPPDATADATARDGAVDAASSDAEPADSMTPDGGPPDAPADAPPETGPAGCADAGYLFCDDFEGTLANWTTSTASGSVQLDPTFACSGKQSVHVTESVNAPTSGQVYAVGLTHPSSLPADAFVRVFGRFKTRPTHDFTLLLVYAGANGVQEELNAGQFNGENYGFGTHMTWLGPSARIGPCECIEMEISRTSGHVRVSVDGQGLTDIAYGTIPTFDTIEIGTSVLAATQSFSEEIWLDDFAYDGKPIGCAR